MLNSSDGYGQTRAWNCSVTSSPRGSTAAPATSSPLTSKTLSIALTSTPSRHTSTPTYRESDAGTKTFSPIPVSLPGSTMMFHQFRP